jgi:rhamnopyranosyl-N-acetylglucosaminyl-diphospho-decaprenol beta-1,3/1,4-galactofuranosyltransferase
MHSFQTESERPERVCAVVVTFNRKELLRECLYALFAQARKVDEILVVNNASTDDTRAVLETEFAGRVRVLHLPKNIGGAGGFHEGMKWAYEQGFDWVWVMDDDTMARPESLSELFAARARFGDTERQPCLFASKVVWIDGTLHPMNVPTIKRWDERDPESLFTAAERATMSIRFATFVSLLMHRRIIEEHGLPVADYFIWNDDAEYTARVLRHDFGVMVPSSLVVHKTAIKHTALDAAPQRFYFQVRNVVWMLTRSKAWSAKERIGIVVMNLQWTWKYLRRMHFSWASLRAVTTGVLHGLFKSPRAVVT